MRKNIFYLLLVLSVLSVCLIPSFVMASTCSYEEQAKLNGIAANVKVNYEEASGNMPEDEYTIPDNIVGTDQESSYVLTYDYFKINILNITSDVYVSITNNVTSDNFIIKYSDTNDGMYVYNWYNIDKITTFTITVYSSENTGCSNEKYAVSYLVTPRYNEYYTYDLCQNRQDKYYCQKYVTFEEMNFNDFLNEINTDINNNVSNSEENNNKWIFWNKYKTYILTLTFAFLITLGFVYIKKRRNK